jgi:muramidase (phage lysozyme)
MNGIGTALATRGTPPPEPEALARKPSCALVAGTHRIVGEPTGHRWIGGVSHKTGQGVQGRLMSAQRPSANGEAPKLLWWLQSTAGRQYVLKSATTGQPITTFEHAIERAQQIIERGQANHLDPLPRSGPGATSPPARSAAGISGFGQAPTLSGRRADRVDAVSQGGIIRAATQTPGEGPYAITPERRALLNTLRFAEGTWLGGADDGYRVMFGGRQVQSLDRHPEQVHRSSRYVSAAAGAYQFLPRTWAATARSLGLGSFGPAAQDQAALRLADKRGALAIVDRNGLTREALARLAPEWASLPKHNGESYYRQPVKSHAELQRFYNSELARLQQLQQQQPPPRPTLFV